MVLSYENSPDELKELSPRELNKRLYKIIEIKKNQRLRLRYHREAQAAKDVHDEMKKELGVTESSAFSFKKPARLLNIGSGEFSAHLLFEGIDFTISIDGEIRFLR